jgi:hypothetical protein
METTMLRIKTKGALALATMMAAITSAACDNGQILPPPLTTTASSTTTGTDASTASASSGSGGSGGSGSSSGSSGSGGSGGSAPACLDAAAIADVLTLKDDTLCAVARYDADEELGFNTPSWGSHGGPLTVRVGVNGAFDLVRWTPPAGEKVALTKKATSFDAKIPATGFLGGQAVDLPFFGWTALSWTGAYPDLAGELLLVKGSAIDKRYPTNGAFATAGSSGADAQGRLLLTGLSPVGDAKAGDNALYAADTCGTAAQPSLLPGQDASCKAPIDVASWGDSSGPVTFDHDGNAFAVMTSFDGTQEARGFDAASIARGAGPTAGVKLFAIEGYGANVAALAPTGAAPGIVAYQPSSGTTFKPEDLLEQQYTVTGGKLAAVGTPKPMIHATTADAFLYVMADDHQHLWVGTDLGAGATYVVLARKP